MSNDVKEQYSGMAARNERLRRSLVHQIEYIVSDSKLTLGVPVESRVKTLASIVEKLERKSIKIANITELDDLVGVRIIFLFRRDMMAIEGLLKEKLKVVSVEDVSARLSEIQFGYQSKHYIVSIPEAWQSVPEFTGLNGLKAEIQIRQWLSIFGLQHHISCNTRTRAASHPLSVEQFIVCLHCLKLSIWSLIVCWMRDKIMLKSLQSLLQLLKF